MITLTVTYPGWQRVRISTDDPTSPDTRATRTLIAMLMRGYRDNGCQV
jgi:hypothetical protein